MAEAFAIVTLIEQALDRLEEKNLSTAWRARYV